MISFASPSPSTPAASAPVVSSSSVSVVRLDQLAAGAVARLHDARLATDDCALLRALGLTDRCLLRVCKAGEPCIVQVRDTRIGLSMALARGIFVIPEAAA